MLASLASFVSWVFLERQSTSAPFSTKSSDFAPDTAHLGPHHHHVEDMVHGTTSCSPARGLDLTCWQKKEQKEAENAEGQKEGGKKKKVTAALLRVQKGKSGGRTETPVNLQETDTLGLRCGRVYSWEDDGY